MILVGIAGRAGAGKSLVAYGLSASADYRKVSFAQPLKLMAARFLISNYGYSQYVVDYHLTHKTVKIPELGVSMRHFLQTLGTEWGRNLINPYIWINMAADRIADYMKTRNVVVDDVRFETEATMIRGFGGLIIHLVRPGGAADEHVSESGIVIRPGDVVIVNDGSRLALMGKVSAAIDRFRRPGDRLLELCHTPCWSYRP